MSAIKCILVADYAREDAAVGQILIPWAAHIVSERSRHYCKYLNNNDGKFSSRDTEAHRSVQSIHLAKSPRCFSHIGHIETHGSDTRQGSSAWRGGQG
jgi:hypothetical protein